MRKAISCTVSVVPISAPRITPRACWSTITPALAKLTIIAVVALLLWIIMVTTTPDNSPWNLLEVSLHTTSRSFPPAAFWSPRPLNLMPKRKMARPPRSPTSIQASQWRL